MDNDINASTTLAPYPPAKHSIVGFSASREEADETGSEIMLGALGQLWKMGGFITGACVGGDYAIATWLATVYPKTTHLVVIPANHSRIAAWWDESPWNDPLNREPVIWTHQMPPGSSYADRNQVIVDRCTVLVAFPAHPEDHPASRRSGTWMTVRRALKAGRETHVFPLDGSSQIHIPASPCLRPAR